MNQLTTDDYATAIIFEYKRCGQYEGLVYSEMVNDLEKLFMELEEATDIEQKKRRAGKVFELLILFKDKTRGGVLPIQTLGNTGFSRSISSVCHELRHFEGFRDCLSTLLIVATCLTLKEINRDLQLAHDAVVMAYEALSQKEAC